MAAKIGFRQHIMLVFFLDLLIIMFLGLGQGSILSDFLLNPEGLDFTTAGALGAVIITVAIGFSAVGVTAGSNFAGTTGILGTLIGGLARGGSTTTIMGVATLIILDYMMLYKIITAGAAFGYFNIVAILIIFPLIVDALFASIDWMRGTVT